MTCRKTVFSITMLILVGALLLSGFGGDAVELFDLNTRLMKATFKIQGEGSCGTAFIVTHPREEGAQTRENILVTAAHILERTESDSVQVILRKEVANSRYTAAPHWVRIREGDKCLWVSHDDGEVDVAVMRIELPPYVEIPAISTDLLADDPALEYIGLHPGQELMCLGYPFCEGYGSGEFSILRTGRVATYPLLPARQVKAFLYDFEVFKGNSGGPVYFVGQDPEFSGRSKMDREIQIIVGLVSKEVVRPEVVQLPDRSTIEQQRLGLARVVHACFIKEVIEKLVRKN